MWLDLNRLEDALKENIQPQSESLSTENAMRNFMKDFSNTIFLYGQFSFPRRSSVTKKGYMGRVPHLTQPSDIVGLIFGALVPFIPRLMIE